MSRQSTITRPRESHGLCESSEYTIWKGIRRRCTKTTDKKFKDYGGRGIRVCERWMNSFVAFYSDMGARPSTKHSVERRDNNGDYSPDNCYWATTTQQLRNTRINTTVVYKGERRLLIDVADTVGIKVGTLRARLRYGWSIDEAVATHVRVWGR